MNSSKQANQYLPNAQYVRPNQFGYQLTFGLLLGVALVTSGRSAWAQFESFEPEAPAAAEKVEQAIEPRSRAELKKEEFFRAVNDPELVAELDAQYLAIQAMLENTDVFDPELAERYLSYAFLLREAGRLDEAVEFLVDAWHVQKVNYGLFDARHRDVLSHLVDLELAFTRKRRQLA